MTFLRVVGFLIVLHSCPVYAQIVSGYVRDRSNKAVEFSNVVLQNASDSVFLAGTLSDSAGYYAFEKIKSGNYRIMANQVGYQKTFSEVLRIGDNPVKQDFVLQEDHVQLGEVVVQAHKSMITQEPGKMVINVENTVSSAGLMAIDLLKRMPGVLVDNNGNISLKGKSEVLFMIDEKPSYLSARQIAIILRSLPSNQISNIEIITSPSAKYDARGNAGIININLKKSDKKGVTGTLQLSLGHGYLPKSNIGGSVAAGIKKWQLNAMYDFTANKNLDASEAQRNFGLVSQGYRYNMVQKYIVPVETHNYRLSAEYTPYDKLTIGITHRGMFIHDRWTSTNTGEVLDAKKVPVQTIVSHDNNPNYNNEMAIGGNTKYKIDSLGQIISLDFEGSRYQQRSRQQIFTSVYNHDTLSTLDFRARIPLDNYVFFAKADYTKPITKALKLETGYKYSYLTIDNVIEYRVEQTGNFLPQIPPDNAFEYAEQIHAGYVSVKWDSTRWGFQLGLRAEHWHANGQLKGPSFTRDSLQFFPNLQARYKLHPSHELTLAASRRIDRPNYLTLNPIAYYIDPYSYFIGNPRTQPQSTYALELSHNYKSGLLVTTLNYSNTGNFIYQFSTSQSSDTSKIQYLGPSNVASFENYGISSSLYVPVNKWWTAQLYANVFRNRFSGQANKYQIDQSITTFTANMTQQFLLPKAWALEITGNYSSPTIYGYNRNQSMGMLSFGIKKDLFAGRVVAKLNAQDVFYTFKYQGTIVTSDQDAHFLYRWDNRVVTFSLVWKLDKSASLLKQK